MTNQNHPKRVSAVVLLREDGAALLQLRDEKPGLARAGMWVMPGGHCDPGESMADCARREFREETDYDCADLKFLLSMLDTDDVTGTTHDLFIYWGVYDGVRPYRCLEGQELRFVARTAADAMPIPPCLLQAWDAAMAANSKPPQTT